MPNLQPGYYMVTSPPVVANGIVIVGGSINDNLSVHNPSGVVRGFDAMTGRLVWNFDPGRPDQTSPLRKLWQSRLPAGGQATPITYRAHGRQMVVGAAGGHGSFGTEIGDAVVAYSLE
ncbi:MAG: hypothetical protein ACJ8G3_05190 [Burkholderiaceae bacterium]